MKPTRTRVELTFALSDNGNAAYVERDVGRHLAVDHTARQWFDRSLDMDAFDLRRSIAPNMG